MTSDEFKSVFDENYDAIRSYIYYRSGDQEMANDVAQEVFMKLWEKNMKREKVAPGLLYKMARDLFISRYRRSKLQQKYLEGLELSFDYQSPVRDLEYRETEEIYINALRTMPEKQRVTFLMSRSEELTYPQIADRLGLSLKAVEKRMNQALKYLKENLNRS